MGMNDDSLRAAIYEAVTSITAAVTMSIYCGWAFSVIWGWFMVPVFGLPRLSIAAAIGISTMLSMTRLSSQSNKDSHWKLLAYYFVIVTVSLLVAWIAHLFM